MIESLFHQIEEMCLAKIFPNFVKYPILSLKVMLMHILKKVMDHGQLDFFQLKENNEALAT